MEGTTVESFTRDGVEIVYEIGGEGPLVLLAHGFPELAYSWRHQVPALIKAGYRVVAPDQRGYGRSSRPEAIEDYDIANLSSDLMALLDHLGEEQAVFVGHDWGGGVVWWSSVLAPERVKAVVGMSVPFQPRPAVSPLVTLRERHADGFFYVLYFQEPGPADAEMSADPARTMQRLMAGPRSPELVTAHRDAQPAGTGLIDRMPEPADLPEWLSQAELDHYVAEFTRTGFTGGLNWYRNIDRNWKMMERVAQTHVRCPSLFIQGTNDPVRAFLFPEPGKAFLDDHRGDVYIEGAGHWVQQERPAEVNAALLDFLGQVTERKSS